MAELLDISMKEYLELEQLSKTDLCTLLDKTPRHFHAGRTEDYEEGETEAQFKGSLLHTLVLEPTRADERYVLEPDTTKILKGDGTPYASPRSTQAYKAATFKLLANKPEAQIVKREDWERAEKVAAELRRHAVFQRLLGPEPLCERTVLFEEQFPDENGEMQAAQMKTRPDAHREHEDRVVWVDMKSTRNAHPVDFGQQANRLRYHVGAYLQTRGLWELYKKPVLGMAFAFETGPLLPHAVYLYTGDDVLGVTWTPTGLQSLAMRMGRHDAWESLNIWLTCTRTGRWPSYNAGKIAPVWVPPWRKRQFEDEEFAAATTGDPF